MLNKRIEEMINDQMNFEIYSSYIYLAMAAYCDSEDLTGFASWFNVQVKEELFHVEQFYKYLVERGGRPTYTAIDAPQKDWESPLAAFENALVHEGIVTDRINKIMTAALEENDHATVSFLKWFIDEQVEEEASVDAVIKQLRLIGDSGQALFFMNRELAARTFTTPAV